MSDEKVNEEVEEKVISSVKKKLPTKAQLSSSRAHLEHAGYKVIADGFMICNICEKEKSIKNRNFYKSNARVHSGSGHLPICNSCLEDMYADIMKKNDLDEKLSFYYLLMEINAYYSERMWQSVKDKRSKIGIYLGKVNSMIQYADRSFYESDEFIYEQEDMDIEEAIEAIEKGDTVLTKTKRDELVDRFGSHYTNEQLLFLDGKYREWITRHVCEELSQEVNFAEISIKQLELREARKNNKATEKILDALDKLMKANNVQPQTMKNNTSSDGLARLGLVVKDWEQHRPAEFFEDKKIFKDYDGILEKFKKEVVRPMKNFLTGSRDFDPDYNINEED